MRYSDYMRHGANEGMGGFLDPPGYPTHTYSVGSGRRDNPHSLMSLEAAIYEISVDPKIQQQARELIAAWFSNRPALDSPEVQEWIGDCTRHWANCWYSQEPDNYGSHVASPHSKHVQPRPEGAIDYALYHIHRFYPEYQPTQEGGNV